MYLDYLTYYLNLGCRSWSSATCRGPRGQGEADFSVASVHMSIFSPHFQGLSFVITILLTAVGLSPTPLEWDSNPQQ